MKPRQETMENHLGSEAEPTALPVNPANPAGVAEVQAPVQGRTGFGRSLQPRSSSLLIVLIILATILVLQFAQAILIPIVLSVLLSYALAPIVTALVRFKIPRALGAGVVLLAAATLIAYGVYSLSDETMDLVNNLPSTAQKLRRALRSSRNGQSNVLEKVQQAATEIEETAKEAAGDPTAPRGVTRVQIEEKPIDVKSYLRWGGSSLVAFVTQIALIAFFVYFILSTGDLFKRKLVKISGPSLARKRVTVHIIDQITKQIERFLLVQLSACLVVMVLCGAAFHLVHLDHATLWGMAAGLLVLIPYFGAVIITVLVGLGAFLQFGTLPAALGVAALSFCIRGLETFLITPYLMGRAARMNGVAVFAGLLFWGWMWGVWGMLLAVPMMVILKSVCDHIEGLEAVGELLGK